MRILLGLLVLFCGVSGFSGCGSNSSKAQPTTSTIPPRPSQAPEGGAAKGGKKTPPPTEASMAPAD